MDARSDPRSTRLTVDGTYNFREVAPGLLREGRLYRSDALHRLTPAGRAALQQLGISRVIDLRSRLDRSLTGTDRLRAVGAEYISIPMAGAGRKTDLTTLTLRSVHRTVLDRHGPQIGLAIRAIADADGPVVVHCTAGKDRTGLVIALTLLALGFDYEQVAADFEASGGNLAGEWTDDMVRRARRFRIRITDDLLEVLAGSPERALREALQWVGENHGSIGGYLRHVGVDGDVIRRLHLALDRR